MRHLWLLCLTLLLLIPPVVAETTEWKVIERPYATYYVQEEDQVERIDAALQTVRQDLIALLQDSLDYRPDIYLPTEKSQFVELLGGRLPDWGAAAAAPSLKRIVIKSPGYFQLGKPITELMAHEYSHLALADRLGFQEPPRWLDEGLAMYVSLEWSWSDNLAMSRAAVFRQYIPLAEIQYLNRYSEDRAHVAYAQSYLAVDYLLTAYGRNSFLQLLDSLARGRPLDSALLAATGSTTAGFQEEFFASLGPRFNIMSLFMDTIFLWLFLALVVIVAGIMRFRKRRRYYEKWEREERLRSTDFDYGDPDNPESADDDEPWRR